MTAFSPGDTVVLQEVWRGKIWAARPMRVIEDDSASGCSGTQNGMSTPSRSCDPGDWHALWVSWLPSGEHWAWYVNLQEPFRRGAVGFETKDLMLDLIVESDRTWRWKDEDELQTFVERGLYDAELSDRIRAEGLRVAACAERDEPPFCEPWAEWQPPPEWEEPELPEGWERLCR